MPLASDRVCDVKMCVLSCISCSVLRSRTLYSYFQTCTSSDRLGMFSSPLRRLHTCIQKACR